MTDGASVRSGAAVVLVAVLVFLSLFPALAFEWNTYLSILGWTMVVAFAGFMLCAVSIVVWIFAKALYTGKWW